jgi:hypothetical protein
MKKKKWMNGDFSTIQSLYEQKIPYKVIANKLNVTPNALYKAVRRFKLNQNKNYVYNNPITFITETQLIELAFEYNISFKNHSLYIILMNVNKFRQTFNLSQVILYNPYDSELLK